MDTDDSPRHPPSTEQCVHRASQGDSGAVEELVTRYLPELEAYVRRRQGGVLAAKESASDLVQSCCREVLEHIDRYRFDGEEGFKRWLFATALRKIQDRYKFYRAAKRDAGLEVPGAAQGDGKRDLFEQLVKTMGTPSRVVERAEQIGRMQRLLEKLDEKDRQIVQLVYLDQRSPSEVAQQLGITGANARVRLSRALARLASLLRQEESAG